MGSLYWYKNATNFRVEDIIFMSFRRPENYVISKTKYMIEISSLFTLKFTQSHKTYHRIIIPSYFYRIFAMLGGFWGMFTSLSLWILKPYIAYQFGKSSIKKLYKHSKVKEFQGKEMD